MTSEFAGQVVGITGGGRGIGLGLARRFAEEGAHVAIFERDKTRAGQAAMAVGSRAYTVDVSDYQALSNAVDDLVSETGRLDVWINNAGLVPHGKSETLPVAVWQRAIDVMLSGAFYGCQLAGRVMLKQGRGSIINVASVNALAAIEGRAAYSAAKAGLIQLTRVLGVEWARRGVRVNAVAPGVIETEMVQEAIASGAADIEAYRLRHPLGRLGQVEEVAEAVLFLASEEASYVTAECLRVDGGYLAYQYFYPAATWDPERHG